MKYYIILLLVHCYCNGISQLNAPYTSFLSTDTSILWAGESDKILDVKGREGKYTLKGMYMALMQGHFIKAYHLDSNQKTLTPYLFKNPDMDVQSFARDLSVERLAYNYPKEWVFTDLTKNKDDYNRYVFKMDDKTFTKDSCCGCDPVDAFRVKQILYYKNQRFYIYNAFMTLLCARKTETRLLAWYPLLNVAYNPSHLLPDTPVTFQLLNTDAAEYDFMQHQASGTDVSLFQTDIYQLLQEDLKKGKLHAYDYETNTLIPPGELLSWKAPVDTVVTEDKDGRYSQKTVIRLTKPKDLCRFRIFQRLYFDVTNEKLYSVIESIILMQAMYSVSGTLMGYKPFAKLQTAK